MRETSLITRRAARSVSPEVKAEATEAESARGVAAFAGIESPLTCINGAGPDIGHGDIDSAESFFRGRGTKLIVFRIGAMEIGADCGPATPAWVYR